MITKKKRKMFIFKLSKFFGGSDLKNDKWLAAACEARTVTRCWNKKKSKFSKSCPKSSNSRFYLNLKLIKIDQKVAKYLGYFCNTICCPKSFKISQSSHTGKQAVDDKWLWQSLTTSTLKVDLTHVVVIVGGSQFYGSLNTDNEHDV